uniref:Uncharacterized protein n=1 Tax=Anguilla anguilla TaxID=7936 RepID=A0A0E9XRY8_ANGAN
MYYFPQCQCSGIQTLRQSIPVFRTG